MATDKTGAPTTVTLENDRFTIAVDGQAVGEAVFTERGLQRIFLHTEVAADFEGRGLATILVGEALDQGRRPAHRCGLPVGEGVSKKHQEYADVVEPRTHELVYWLKSS